MEGAVMKPPRQPHPRNADSDPSVNDPQPILTITESDWDAHLNSTYTLGQVAMTEDLAKLFRARSGEAFARDRHEEADLLKRLAVEWDEKANAARVAYTKAREALPALKWDGEDS